MGEGMKKKIRTVQCTRCDGVGKVESGWCNCGSGEGCSMHDLLAISMWGPTCLRCKGKGSIEINNT